MWQTTAPRHIIDIPRLNSPFSSILLELTLNNRDDWRSALFAAKPDHKELARVLSTREARKGGKTRNVEVWWLPKSRTSLTDLRDTLKVALERQEARREQNGVSYFLENDVAE